jgi:hypothetical protein
MWAAVWRWLSLNGCSVLFLDCAEGTGEVCAGESFAHAAVVSSREGTCSFGRTGRWFAFSDAGCRFLRSKRVLVLLCERVLSLASVWDDTNTMREGLDDLVLR